MVKNTGNHDHYYKPLSSVRSEIGDLVICINSKLKYIESGKIYLVDKVDAFDRIRHGVREYNCDKVKIKGHTSYLSASNFDLVDDATIREIGVDKLLGNKDVVVKEKPLSRKLDRISDPEKTYELSQVLLKLTNAVKYYKYDDIKFTNIDEYLESNFKTNKFGFKLNDYDKIKDMKVSDFINEYIDSVHFKKENSL